LFLKIKENEEGRLRRIFAAAKSDVVTYGDKLQAKLATPFAKANERPAQNLNDLNLLLYYTTPGYADCWATHPSAAPVA
jgi:hypothetical protein